MGQAKIVFDRFHVVQLLNRAVDEVRHSEQRRLQRAGEAERARALKGTRFLWTRDVQRHTPEDRERLRVLEAAGHDVGRAWALKKMALELWRCASREQAERYFEHWAEQVEEAALRPLQRAAKTLRRYLYGILAFLEQPYTNALSEALNAKIQEIKYRARGYRNWENFRLAINFHCGGLNMNPRESM